MCWEVAVMREHRRQINQLTIIIFEFTRGFQRHLEEIIEIVEGKLNFGGILEVETELKKSFQLLKHLQTHNYSRKAIM